MCRTNFNSETYKSILEAMVLMFGGKTMKILDSHTTHFKHSVDAATKRSIITSLLAEAEMFLPEELERLKIVTLCRRLQERHFPLCLNLMFEQFCNYLFTYHAMTVWLQDAASAVGVDEKTAKIYRELREGLMKHKRVLWEQQMQENVSHMLSAIKINEIQIQTFLGILGSLSKFIEIVEEFGGTMAHTLRETFKEHSKVYFTQFHRTRLEQLRDELERESWSPLPTKKGFGLKDFKELQDIVVATMPQQRAYKRRKQSFFDGISVQGNPFAAETEGMDMDEEYGHEGKKKQIARYKWEEINGPELLVDFVDEMGGQTSASKRPTALSPNAQHKQNNLTTASSATLSGANSPFATGAPLVAMVGSTLVTMIGEYMHLMQLLTNLTPLVFDGLVQLVEYFLWSMHSFFAVCRPALSNGERNLAIILRRIQTDLLLDQATYEALAAAQIAAAQAAASQGLMSTTSSMISGVASAFSLSSKDPPPETKATTPALPVGTLTPGGAFFKDTLGSPTALKMARPRLPSSLLTGTLQQQISQIAVATGSLRFLRQVLGELQPNLVELLGRDRMPKVIGFAGTLAETTVPLRAAIFRYAPQGTVNVDKTIASISTGQWDSLDEDVRESAYVKPLIKDVSTYIEKLKAMVKQNQLQADLLPEMVTQTLSFVMELCVEGYSKARRVTIEGHNVMLYDMQELKAGLEKAAGVRNHDWAVLDEFVHAYHFPCDDLMTFFREHPSYTKNQLSGLVSSGPWTQKEKTKMFDALNYHGAFTSSASNSQSASNRSKSSSTSAKR